jgi:uncharacterized protein (TIGR00255 family)
MKSMTGFGRATESTKELELDISLKSVNGRFLEIRLHMPREYASLESEFKKSISKYLTRGTVDLYVNRRPGPAADTADVQVRAALAKKWLKAYKDLAKELKLKQQPDLEMISRAPDVLKIEDRSQMTDAEKKLVIKTVADAVKACDSERVREGKSLQLELTKLLADLESRVQKMEGLRADANKELEKKFRERLDRLGLEGTVDPQRLTQEIILQIDRTDIAEEIQRLREHIKAYRDLLQSKDSQGKKLDFYAQELLREVNTVGSKSHVAALTAEVVDAKTLVERIREQVQNAE